MQDVILDILLFQGKIQNGFFIEAGAWDFRYHSNSLWNELKYNWTGLLIEPILDQCLAGQLKYWRITEKIQYLVEEKMPEETLGLPAVVYPQRKSQGIINIT